MIIDEKIWELLEIICQNSPEIKCANSTDKEIAIAEEELEVKFSDFYRYFLKNHQISCVGERKVNTLNKSTKSLEDWSVIEETKKFKNKMGDYTGWYIVSENEYGDLIAENDKREIWVLYRDSDFIKDKIANNFEEFLSLLLKQSSK